MNLFNKIIKKQLFQRRNKIDETSNKIDETSSIIDETSTSEITDNPSVPKCINYEDGANVYLGNCKYALNNNGDKFVYIYVLSSNFTGLYEKTMEVQSISLTVEFIAITPVLLTV